MSSETSIQNGKHGGSLTDNTKERVFKLKFAGKTEKSAVWKAVALVLYIVMCLLSYIVLFSIIAILLPPLILFNLLKYIERKLTFVQSQAHALKGEDALWQDDRPWNRTIINGIFIFEGKFLHGTFRDAILERGVDCRNHDGTLKYPRFTYCIRKGYFQYFWEKEKDFKIDDHILLWEGDIPSSKNDLQDLVSELTSKPLPDDKSPWLMIVIPTNYDNHDTVIVVRMSHSIADGVALNHFIVHQLPDNTDIAEKEPVRFSMKRKLSMMIKAVLVAPAILLGKLLLFSDSSILHGPHLNGIKNVAWTEGIDLDLIKHIKNKTGTTVNDVLMTCMSMALRSYYISKGAEIPSHFTSCVPVDVRSRRGEELEFMNRFAVVFLRLPIGQSDCLSLLSATKANMDVIKTSGEPIVLSNAMHYSVEFFPEWIVRPVVSSLTSKSSCVLSNVPGPRKALKIKGHTVKAMIFWPPQRDNIGIGMSIYSFSGKIFVGVQGDVAVLPDPAAITDIFNSKVRELSEVVDQY